MEFAGKWHPFADGKVRPAVDVSVRGADGVLHADAFLLDTGADRTVLSANFLRLLGLPTFPPPTSLILEGIGGPSAYALVNAEVTFCSVDGPSTSLLVDLAAFLDPTTSPHSLLGRDLLVAFDLILSRRRNEIRLLAGHHTYQIVSP